MKALATIANDGNVSVASQARLEAQSQAVSVRALDVDHQDILTSPDTIERVNELLAERFRQGSASRASYDLRGSLDDQRGPGSCCSGAGQ